MSPRPSALSPFYHCAQKAKNIYLTDLCYAKWSFKCLDQNPWNFPSAFRLLGWLWKVPLRNSLWANFAVGVTKKSVANICSLQKQRKGTVHKRWTFRSKTYKYTSKFDLNILFKQYIGTFGGSVFLGFLIRKHIFLTCFREVDPGLKRVETANRQLVWRQE